MRPFLLNPLACLLLVGAALVASVASAQSTPLDQPSTTEVRLQALEAPLEKGIVQSTGVQVTITYPILTSAVGTAPILTHLYVINQPTWLAASLDPGTVVFTPRGPAASGTTFVRDSAVVALQVTLSEEVQEALVGSIEIQACTEPTMGMAASCGVASMLVATAGAPPAPCDGSEVQDDDLETVTTQSATLAGVPVSTLAVAGVASVLGVAGGSVATHLLRRK